MPIRFHRQFTLFPGVKVNMSKTGMSITIGGKGFHLNFSKRGVMQTTNLPGKGLSHRSYLFRNDEDDEKRKDAEEEKKSPDKSEEKPKRNTRRRAKEPSVSSAWGFFLFILIALFFIYFGGRAFGLLPPNLVTDVLSTITQWARQIGL